MSSLDYSLSKVFFLKCWICNPSFFFIVGVAHVYQVWYSLVIWIVWALLSKVADLFATLAPLQLFDTSVLPINVFIFLVFVPDFVLSELAPNRIFGSFPATPPHFSAKFWLMSSAGPIKVLTVLVVLAAIFTQQEVFVHSFSLLQLIVTLF